MPEGQKVKAQFPPLTRGQTVKHTELGVKGSVMRDAEETNDGDTLVRVRWASGAGRIRRDYVAAVR